METAPQPTQAISPDKPNGDEKWNVLLQDTTALQIAKQKETRVIALSSAVLVRDALQVLQSNNFLSAPVVEDNTFIGFVDVLDIASYAWTVFQYQDFNFFGPFGLFSDTTTAEAFFNTTIREVINYSMWNPPLHVMDTTPLTDVMRVFASKFFRPHRIGVLNSANQFSNVISQSDIISFAAQHIEELPVADKPIKSLGMVRAPLLVPMQTTFVDALDALSTNRISGLGIIEPSGKLIANFSASDLRGLSSESFNYFEEPVLNFLKREKATIRNPITCTKESTLREVISKLSSEKIHRIYVVDEQERPIGIVTLSDIMPVLKRKKEKARTITIA